MSIDVYTQTNMYPDQNSSSKTTQTDVKWQHEYTADTIRAILRNIESQTTAYFTGILAPGTNMCTQTSDLGLFDIGTQFNGSDTAESFKTEASNEFKDSLSLIDDFDPTQMSQWTQTCDDIDLLNDPNLADTQTQTCWPNTESDNRSLAANMSLDTSDLDIFVSTETQTSFTQYLFDAATSTADIEIEGAHSFGP